MKYKWIGCVTAFILMFSQGMTVFAQDASILYEGEAERVVMLPSNEPFLNFENVMPGDVLVRTFSIGNQCGKTLDIKMKALVDKNDEPLLNQLILKVEYKSAENNAYKVIYQGKANASWNDISLGNYKDKDQGMFLVTLSVPWEMNNQWISRMGKIKWVFKANEVIPEKEPEEIVHHKETVTTIIKKAVQTGDDIHMGIYLMLMGITACAYVLFEVRKRKYSHI